MAASRILRDLVMMLREKEEVIYLFIYLFT